MRSIYRASLLLACFSHRKLNIIAKAQTKKTSSVDRYYRSRDYCYCQRSGIVLIDFRDMHEIPRERMRSTPRSDLSYVPWHREGKKRRDFLWDEARNLFRHREKSHKLEQPPGVKDAALNWIRNKIHVQVARKLTMFWEIYSSKRYIYIYI